MPRQSIKQREAETLWAELRSALVNVEQAIIRIIETKAWEPLGYDTFAQAWNDRMKGVRVAALCTPHIVYRMFDEGATDEAVADMVPGVSPEASAYMRRQKGNGVPPAMASTRVRSHLRNAPRPPFVLSLELSNDEIGNYKALCDAKGLDVKAEALKAVRAHFARLERRAGK